MWGVRISVFRLSKWQISHFETREPMKNISVHKEGKFQVWVTEMPGMWNSMSLLAHLRALAGYWRDMSRHFTFEIRKQNFRTPKGNIQAWVPEMPGNVQMVWPPIGKIMPFEALINLEPPIDVGVIERDGESVEMVKRNSYLQGFTLFTKLRLDICFSWTHTFPPPPTPVFCIYP